MRRAAKRQGMIVALVSANTIASDDDADQPLRSPAATTAPPTPVAKATPSQSAIWNEELVWPSSPGSARAIAATEVVLAASPMPAPASAQPTNTTATGAVLDRATHTSAMPAAISRVPATTSDVSV